jgi:hypothetical protein
MSRLLEFRFLALEIYKQTVHFPPHNRSLNGGPTWANTGLAAIGVAPAESCHSAFDPLLTFVICSITNK